LGKKPGAFVGERRGEEERVNAKSHRNKGPTLVIWKGGCQGGALHAVEGGGAASRAASLRPRRFARPGAAGAAVRERTAGGPRPQQRASKPSGGVEGKRRRSKFVRCCGSGDPRSGAAEGKRST
jgi:hypothetical protein